MDSMITYPNARMLMSRRGIQSGVQSLRHLWRRDFRLREERSWSQRECANTGSVGEKAMMLPPSIRSCVTGYRPGSQARLMPLSCPEKSRKSCFLPKVSGLGGYLVPVVGTSCLCRRVMLDQSPFIFCQLSVPCDRIDQPFAGTRKALHFLG